MKWLRIAGQHINIGIVPRDGYRVETQIRGEKEKFTGLPVNPLFGSRNGDSSRPFCLFFLSDLVDKTKTRFRADYGDVGADNVLTVDIEDTPHDGELTYSISFGRTTTIDGKSTTGNGSVTGNNYPILVGSINTGGNRDSRLNRMDYGEFTVYDQNDNEVFHGVPVEKGSTEFSDTPAPSNCYYDLVSKTYKVQTGGSGTIGIMEDAVKDTGNIYWENDDYGLKVLDDGDPQMELMNSKYRLFGADITKAQAQFKTFEIVLGGYQNEPRPNYPGFVEDWRFYEGYGFDERDAFTIDTGFPGDTLKMISVQADKVTPNNYQGRAWQHTSGGPDNVNTYLVPVEKHPPSGMETGISNFTVVNGHMKNKADIINGSGGRLRYNTIANFNAGTIPSYYRTTPAVRYQMMPDGRIKIFTTVPYHWLQRGGPDYRAQWRDWVWLQGISIRITVLNTPYKV